MNFLKRFSWILTFLVLLELSESSRILVVLPSFSRSHHFVYRPALRALAERGHSITYITFVPWDDRPANVDQRIIDFNMRELMGKAGITLKTLEVLRGSATSIQKTDIYSAMLNAVIQMTLETPVMRELMNSKEQYDLVMSEAMRGTETYSAFTHRFNASGVVFLTRGDNSWPNELCGLPDNPSYMVDATSSFTDKMHFWERLQNTYESVYRRIVNYYNLRIHQELVDKYFVYSGSEARPPITQLISDQALVLVNSHHSVGYSYPKAPHVKEVGGINIPSPMPLPKEFESYLNDSTHGLVYFSTGSNMDFTQFGWDKEIKIIANVFSKRKERVFWKAKHEEKVGKISNILISSWFPQLDLLAHNKTKAFVSHGGMLSMMEAVSCGVPIVGIPIMGDQEKNLKRAVEQGYALMVELKNLSESSLTWALDEVINNPKYKEKAMKHKNLFYDRPMKPVDEAVYWIEYVLKHGKVLQPASALMPFYQLHSLDVLGLILFSLILAITIGKKFVLLVVKSTSVNKKPQKAVNLT